MADTVTGAVEVVCSPRFGIYGFLYGFLFANSWCRCNWITNNIRVTTGGGLR